MLTMVIFMFTKRIMIIFDIMTLIQFYRCAIDLSRLEREKTHNIWKDLEDGNGQIFLLLTISGTTQSETITDLSSYKENPRDREIIERRYVSNFRRVHITPDEREPKVKVFKLKIKLLNLVSKEP